MISAETQLEHAFGGDQRGERNSWTFAAARRGGLRPGCVALPEDQRDAAHFALVQSYRGHHHQAHLWTAAICGEPP